MGKMSVVAGVVTFNPDLDRLHQNLAAALAEVDEVIVIDNASANILQIEGLVEASPRIHLLRNRTNGGIAKALNQTFTWAAERRTGWVLLLDQDSVASPGMVNFLAANAGENVGIVAPAIIDRSDRQPSSREDGPSAVNYCITSGSLCSVQAWQAVGGYDESMFIDFVDFDFCLRMRQKGYLIVREPAATLLHEIGKISRHGRFTAYHHSAFRSYHMARDMLYYAYKHRSSSQDLKVHTGGLPMTYLVLARKAFVIALYEEDRVRRLWSILKGVVVGTYVLRHAQSSRRTCSR